MNGSLKGKVALITGSSRGIGRATAKKLASEGADLFLNYYEPLEKFAKQEPIKETVSIVKQYGVDAISFEADVSSKESVSRMANELERKFGKLDILVNNAGISTHRRISDLGEDLWDRILAVNLKGQFLVTQAVLPLMIKAGGGKIVNLSSELALIGSDDTTAYCASKAGVIGFTKALARELAPHNILVNCVAPGPTDTDMLPADQRAGEYLKGVVLGRVGKPEEIASAIYFLVSPDTTWTTGQVFSPNGGAVI